MTDGASEKTAYVKLTEPAEHTLLSFLLTWYVYVMAGAPVTILENKTTLRIETVLKMMEQNDNQEAEVHLPSSCLPLSFMTENKFLSYLTHIFWDSCYK